jgi:predicted HTH domain antitoxin
MLLTIDLPDSFQLYNRESLLTDIRLSIALMFFQQKKISIGKALQISNLSVYEFQKECQKNKIPIVDYETDELKDEFKLLKQELM